MRLIPGETELVPESRKVTVELTGREVAVIARGLYLDNPADGALNGQNYTLYNDFDNLRVSLGVADLDALESE